MSILSSLFGRRNPTSNWLDDPVVPLILDLSSNAISGAAIGAPFDRLSFLGTGTAIHERNRDAFAFPAKGIIVDIDPKSRIKAFDIHFVSNDDMRAFPGKVVHYGIDLKSGPDTREIDIEEYLGDPWWHAEDEQHILLFYELGDIEWRIELGPMGGMRAIVMGPPLLADPEQRRAFGVTKVWPPE